MLTRESSHTVKSSTLYSRNAAKIRCEEIVLLLEKPILFFFVPLLPMLLWVLLTEVDVNLLQTAAAPGKGEKANVN